MNIVRTATSTTATASGVEIPWLISVDDHVLEPRDLWQRELPLSWRDRGPRVSREKARLSFRGGAMTVERDVDDGHWCDMWLFDELVLPTGLLHAPAGIPPERQENLPAIYEDFRPGTWDQAARLADMDTNRVEASINYPNTFPRFAGQGFAERGDKELALACLQIYNNWMMVRQRSSRSASGVPCRPSDSAGSLGSKSGERGSDQVIEQRIASSSA